MEKSTIFISASIVVIISHSLFASSWKPAAAHTKLGKSQILVSEEPSRSDEIVLRYALPEPVFTSHETQKIQNQNTFTCELGNAVTLHQEGFPLLPFVICRIILPCGTAIKKIEAIFDDEKVWPEPINLSYGTAIITQNTSLQAHSKPNMAVYNSNKRYPESPVSIANIARKNGVTIAIVHLFPITYFPLSQTIHYTRHATIHISTTKDTAHDVAIRVDTDRFQSESMIEDNPSQLKTYTNNSVATTSKQLLSGSQEVFDYLIITNDEIIQAETTPRLSDFVNLKKSQGLTCKVQDIKTILETYTGTDKSEKIRRYIRDCYNTNKIKYVLLAGDTNIIPLKRVTVSIFVGGTIETDNIPSDLPYQCLDGASWSNDYESEVYIGRVCAENAEEFSHFVYKTKAFQTDAPTQTYKKSILNVGELLVEPPMSITNVYADDFLKNLETYCDGYTFDYLSDKKKSWTPHDIISKINSNNYSFINHVGHSRNVYNMKLASSSFLSSKGVMIKKNWVPDSFTNTKMTFLYTQGCIPGAFDTACIGEDFTTSNRTGMFAGVFNSRYGLFAVNPFTNEILGPSPDLHNSFVEKLFMDTDNSIGACNAYSHSINASMINNFITGANYKWVIVTSNLFGDPSVTLTQNDLTSIPHNTFQNTTIPAQITTTVFSLQKRVVFSYSLGKNTHALLSILTPTGKRVYSTLINSSANKYMWDMRSTCGNSIAAGLYIVSIKTLDSPLSSFAQSVFITTAH